MRAGAIFRLRLSWFAAVFDSLDCRTPKVKPFHFFRVIWRKIRGCSGGADLHAAIARREKSSENLSAFVSPGLFALSGFESRWAHQLSFKVFNNVIAVRARRFKLDFGKSFGFCADQTRKTALESRHRYTCRNAFRSSQPTCSNTPPAP
jgi:hypothetical protein